MLKITSSLGIFREHFSKMKYFFSVSFGDIHISEAATEGVLKKGVLENFTKFTKTPVPGPLF